MVTGKRDVHIFRSIKSTQMKGVSAALSLILLLLLSTGSSGCGARPKVSALPEKTITDMAGRTVKVPASIKKIAITCYGGPTQEITALGASAKIIAQPSMQAFRELLRMKPEFKNLPQVGTFDNVNIEEILKLKPDVVIASASSAKGNKKIEDAGIPVITVLTGRENLKGLTQEFAMMGRLLNKEKEAETLINYWHSNLQMIRERLAKIPVAQRKTVYYWLGGPLHTNGGSWWGEDFITAAGGVNVAQGIGAARDINIEQLLKWNPEVIIVSSNEGRFYSLSEIKSNSQLSSLQAIRDNQVFECPIGSFWWDRPSPEGILGIMWLAKTLYPSVFADINMKNETRNFFEKFYHYSLSDQEIQAFFNPHPQQI